MLLNPDKKIGKIKPMHAVNNGPIKAGYDQIRGNSEEYKAAGIPYARNHDASIEYHFGGEHVVDVNGIFPDFSKDADDPAAYDFLLTDIYVQTIFEAGAETFYRLGSRIEHWAKKYNTLPPADFEKWAKVCEHIIRHYNEGWADGFYYNIKYWEIWNEPDLDSDDSDNKRNWGGTQEQFFDLFEISAKYLKVCFPNLKIGGPAVAGYPEWAKAFLEEMSKREVPIDFFSWHTYCVEPEAIRNNAKIFRDLLDENGYTKTESILNEWNYVKDWWEKYVYSIEQITGIKGAAFTAACMLEGQNTSIDMMMYYDARPSVFNGLFDFYTCRPIKGYYAIKLFDELYRAGEQIECINDEENIYAVGAVDKDGNVKLLISYYTDDDGVSDEKELEIKIEYLKNTEFKKFLVDKNTNDEAGTVKLDNDGVMRLTMTPQSFVLLRG